MSEEMLYEYWLASVKSLSANKKRKLREVYGSGKAVYYIEETELYFQKFLEKKDVEVLCKAKCDTQLEVRYRRLEDEKIRFVPYFSDKYPKKLLDIRDVPYALYVKGQLPQEKKLSIAIVGARRCTSYGESVALEYGSVLASHGIQVISGMARGIDGAGQRGALNGGGTTYGILGCGVDVCYPRENIGLYMDIQEQGGIISEQCPGEAPLPMYFPQRNRIISGLSDVILIIEAKERSGSLITADMALEQGRDVYALPGPVTSPMSQGCHRLIRQGAGILISPQDLLEELDVGTIKKSVESDKNKKVLETAENLVYSCLGLFPKNVSQLMDETRMPIKQLMEELTTLEIEGKIKEVAKNYYIRTRS